MIKLIIIILLITSCSVPVKPTPVQGTVPAATPSKIDYSRVSISCDSTCSSAEKTVLPGIVKLLEDTESGSCFSDFFKAQPKFDESQGKSVTAILNDLTMTKVSSALTIWYPSLKDYLRGAAKACGFENGDGEIHAKEKCYAMLDDCGKAGLFGHELSHKLGYTHYTAKNQEAGNENTIPYSINRAFAECCNEKNK